MSEITIDFEMPCDSDGYVKFECPFCETEFGLLGTEIQNDDVSYQELFCPYCGLTHNKDHFYSKDVAEHIKNLTENYMAEQLNKEFGKMAKNINKTKNSFLDIKMKVTPLKKGNIKMLIAEDTTEEAFQCKVCEYHVKILYCSGASKVFCAYCGVDI